MDIKENLTSFLLLLCFKLQATHQKEIVEGTFTLSKHKDQTLVTNLGYLGLFYGFTKLIIFFSK